MCCNLISVFFIDCNEYRSIEFCVLHTQNKNDNRSDLRWLKTVSSTFKDVDFDESYYHFYQILQSWYQKTAQSLVNTLVLFS